jgi:diguanylate cyclase (GGDEF)-like protein/PAS domain S-box-containing protein
MGVAPVVIAADESAAELVERLADVEARLRDLTAALPGLGFLRRRAPEGTISYRWLNDAVRAVLGFSPEAMAVNGKGCLHVIHWADRDQHLEAIRRSAESLEPCDEDFRAVTAAGEVRWLKGRSLPSRQADGSVVWTGVLIDVTAGRRAEFRLDMLMEHAADSIFILDDGGAIDMVNAAGLDLFGYETSDLVGRSFVQLFEGGRPALLSDAGAGGIIGAGPGEVTGRRKDGSTFAFEVTAREVRIEGCRLLVAIGRDISLRKRIEEALHDTEQRLGAIAGNLPGMVFQRVLRRDGTLEFTYASEGCRSVLGVEPEELMADAQLFLGALSEPEREKFRAALDRSAHTLEPLEEEMAVAAPGGRRRWLRGRSRPVCRDGGEVAWDGVLLDVTDRKVAEQRLSFLAYYDPLTRLPNRTAFLERFGAARVEARHHRRPLAVLSLGVDRFGIINATMGHEIGDRLLIGLADILQAEMGREDMLARVSGDRFVVLLAGSGDRDGMLAAVERIHTRAQATVAVNGDQVDLSVSVGAALFPRDGDDVETLIRHADAALQRAKAEGPGSLGIFCKEIGSKAAKALTMQTKLRRALDRGELIPYYQPQVDLVGGAVVGMEALVRWNSPDMGMVAPGEFIPVAEESGLIDAICETMLDQCARQGQEWRDTGLPVVPIAVNVSGRQFQYARRLLSSLETVLSKTGLEPRLLEIELTESSAMRDADNAIQVVHQLRDMGVACAIDDFGTGYSSLSVLKRFPINKLKIDKSFVMDVITDPNDGAIVEAIIAMARALKLTVVAEGVEKRGHLDFLRSHGCDQMQGYYFSRPLSAVRMGDLLARGRRLVFDRPHTAEK